MFSLALAAVLSQPPAAVLEIGDCSLVATAGSALLRSSCPISDGEKTTQPRNLTGYSVSGSTPADVDRHGSGSVLPTGWFLHSDSKESDALGITTLDAAAASELGERYAFGATTYATSPGSWGISKDFILQGDGGALTARTMASGRDCNSSWFGQALSSVTINSQTETAMCEDDGFLRFEFYSADGIKLSVPPATEFSTTFFHQAQHFVPAGGVDEFKANSDVVGPASSNSHTSWRFWPLEHSATVPRGATRVRITMVGTDGGGVHEGAGSFWAMKPLGHVQANAATLFSTLYVGYTGGLADVTGNVPPPPPPVLLAWWRFNAGAKENFVDPADASQSIHYSAASAATGAGGSDGGALVGIGDSSHGSSASGAWIATPPVLDLAHLAARRGVTLSFWVKFDGTAHPHAEYFLTLIKLADPSAGATGSVTERSTAITGDPQYGWVLLRHEDDSKGGGLAPFWSSTSPMSDFALVVVALPQDPCGPGPYTASTHWLGPYQLAEGSAGTGLAPTVDVKTLKEGRGGTSTLSVGGTICTDLPNLRFNVHCWATGTTCSSRMHYTLDDLKVHHGVLSTKAMLDLYAVGRST